MKCPECENGKTVNCTGWILTPDDQIGTCETAEQDEVWDGTPGSEEDLIRREGGA